MARYFEDPSINACAQLETERLLERIGWKMRLGHGFFRARELVLAEEMIGVQRAFGRTTASRVSRAVHSVDPAAMRRVVRKAERTRARQFAEAELMHRKGRITMMDWLWLRLTGSPWSTN